jgi:hypothetical protein
MAIDKAQPTNDNTGIAHLTHVEVRLRYGTVTDATCIMSHTAKQCAGMNDWSANQSWRVSQLE